MLPPITKERLFVDVGVFDKPVYLTSADGTNLPDDVWSTFKKAECHCLAKIRSACSRYATDIYSRAWIHCIYMIWADLNRKFVYEYTAAYKVVNGYINLKIERSPAIEIGEDGHKTGNYKAGTKEERWTEKFKQNTKAPTFFGD